MSQNPHIQRTQHPRGRRTSPSRVLLVYGLAVVLLALTASAMAWQQGIPLPGTSTAHRASAARVPTVGLAPPLPTVAATATATASPTATAAPTACPASSNSPAAEQHLLKLINDSRAAAKVAPLTLDVAASNVARAFACELFQRRQITHVGANGSTPSSRLSAGGITYRIAGENVAMAGGMDLMVGLDNMHAEMMAEPIAFPNHHWNIVHQEYTRVAIGVIAVNGQAWFVEDFLG